MRTNDCPARRRKALVEAVILSAGTSMPRSQSAMPSAVPMESNLFFSPCIASKAASRPFFTRGDRRDHACVQTCAQRRARPKVR